MRLLLAEDERALAEALAVIFKRNNYSVDVVHNGKDALEYLGSDVYDGAVLDIMMPGVDGLEVLKRIRADGNGIPVLILTAKSDVDDRVLGLDAGADDYLTKPFEIKELLARVRAMLRRRDVSVSVMIEYGDLKLCPSTSVLYSAAGEARLTNKEYQMLEMLMSAKGGIISVDRFMEKIWGYETETEQSVVWVYVSYLRRRLEGVGSHCKIVAHRNMGYSLEYADD